MVKEIINGREIEYEAGSGNLFADLGFPDPQEALLKADLVAELHRIIQARALTPTAAGARVGLSQAKMNDVLCGRLQSYSVECLLKMINQLGYDAEIKISKRGHGDAPGTLKVRTA